jgi:hypothetical protein
LRNVQPDGCPGSVGDHADVALTGQFVTEATGRLARSVSAYADSYARLRAISGIRLASLAMTTGDPDEASEIGLRALASAGTIRSRRVADDLLRLRALAEPHERTTGVAELRHAIGARVSPPVRGPVPTVQL